MMKKKQDYPLPQKISLMKSKGVNIYAANFKDPIHNETRMTVDDVKPDRRAVMTLTPIGLLVEQAGRRPVLTDNYKSIELADFEWEES